MVFECFKWSPSFKTFKRGVKRNHILFERPRPYFDLNRKKYWLYWFVGLFAGSFVILLVGVLIGFMLHYTVGLLSWGGWTALIVILWLVFWFLHLAHSLKFRKRNQCDVDFAPLHRVRKLGKRVLQMPGDLTTDDYYIFFCRYIWADVENQPFRNIDEWIESLRRYHSGELARSEVSGITGSIIRGVESREVRGELENIAEMGGGIPEPREIVRILQTELIPEAREIMSEDMLKMYLAFLFTDPPLLPYEINSTREDLKRIAEAKTTNEVLDYLKEFEGMEPSEELTPKPRWKGKP